MASSAGTNRRVAQVFGATLLAIGLAGFLVPARRAPTSGAPAYNIFHLLFGAVGIAASRRSNSARAFNIGFGTIDLYQAVASRRGWFPQRWFRWKAADDLLHVVVGAALVGVGARR